MRTSPQRFSLRFWFEKLALLVVAVVLVFASWWLFSYEEEATETAASTNTQTESAPQSPFTQTTTPVQTTPPVQTAPEPTTPEEPEETVAVFPFEFDGNNTEADFPGINAAFTAFTYDFRPNATVQVSRDGSLDTTSLLRDFEWEYSVTADGTVELTSSPITFCTEGDTCGLLNGTLEIIVTPAAGSAYDTIFYIKDSGDISEFTAVETYQPVIESYKETE